jgi:hypothetical protein
VEGEGRGHLPGMAVQVNPMKPTLKAPGAKRLKLNYVELLSNFAFNFNLSRYNVVISLTVKKGSSVKAGGFQRGYSSSCF